jgi:hypothetical protein
MLVQEWSQEHGVMVASVVEHDDHATPRGSMRQQLSEKLLERLGIEDLAHATNELAGAQVDRAEASHGLACGGVQENRILVLGRHPHSTSRTMLLEVAFVETP